MHRTHGLRSLCVAALLAVACRPGSPIGAPAPSGARASDCDDSRPCPPQPDSSAKRDCGDSRPCPPPATDRHDSPNCAQPAGADKSTADLDQDGVPDDAIAAPPIS
ncbi:hypothetical protein [Nannocystis pusilla]|uniref:Uncharacterized protein n=1 Tax=Nannocystis pusilla TaxID=889268 RepID=A0ABS7TLN1_9BACT|nr:hypothetical protein [Nannocystis pusilla]MBZ5709132.1 hypothetical protein [Nannocystis pusilla]